MVLFFRLDPVFEYAKRRTRTETRCLSLYKRIVTIFFSIRLCPCPLVTGGLGLGIVRKGPLSEVGRWGVEAPTVAEVDGQDLVQDTPRSADAGDAVTPDGYGHTVVAVARV